MSLELFKNSGNFSWNILSGLLESKPLFKDRIDESCYKHLGGRETCYKPADYCTLTTWVDPYHAFLDLDCPTIYTKKWNEKTWEVLSQTKAYGFYPSMRVEKANTQQKLHDPKYLTTTEAKAGASASSIAAILMKPKSLFGSKTVIAVGGSVAHNVGSSWKNYGFVRDDSSYYDECMRKKNCAKATFNISRTAGIAAETYIMKIKEACERSDIKECYYRLLSHNCVDFVTDVVKAANLDTNWFKHLAVEKPDYEFNKVWLYVALKAQVWLWGENRVSKDVTN